MVRDWILTQPAFGEGSKVQKQLVEMQFKEFLNNHNRGVLAPGIETRLLNLVGYCIDWNPLIEDGDREDIIDECEKLAMSKILHYLQEDMRYKLKKGIK